MFTGIVREVGVVTAVGPRLRVSAELAARLGVDDSVNVSGACLTVVGRNGGWFECDLAAETRRRTTLGAVAPRSAVNLEAAATPETALGGHFVQGHVDGTTRVVAREGERVRFALDPSWARYVVHKGFIAIDGVSLTVAALERDAFEVALIPHTASRTTLGALGVGDSVNVEVDILGKYVERLLTR
ncbi:MAG TPA: riboflavin synthase [Candidatus Limnocylindria bacterium]|nr:riboflavin synthase [Candidatus Limnocylindria bacterium]